MKCRCECRNAAKIPIGQMWMSAFLGAWIRTRCIRSGRGDISAKRSRGTSSEFHFDRMRTEGGRGISFGKPAASWETIEVHRRTSRTCLAPRARAKDFLKIFLFKRVGDSWFLEDVYWKFVIRKILPNLTYVHLLSMYRNESQRKSAAAVVLVLVETFGSDLSR